MTELHADVSEILFQLLRKFIARSHEPDEISSLPSTTIQRVAVVGPPANGKTTLVRRVLRRLHQSLDGQQSIEVVYPTLSSVLSHQYEDGSTGIEALFRSVPLGGSAAPAPSMEKPNPRIIVLDQAHLWFPTRSSEIDDDDEGDARHNNTDHGSRGLSGQKTKVVSAEAALVGGSVDLVKTLQLLRRLETLPKHIFVLFVATDSFGGNGAVAGSTNDAGNGGGGGGAGYPFDPLLMKKGVQLTLQLRTPSAIERRGIVEKWLTAQLQRSDSSGIRRFVPALIDRIVAKTGGLPIGLVSSAAQDVFGRCLQEQQHFPPETNTTEENPNHGSVEASDVSPVLPLPLMKLVDESLGDVLHRSPFVDLTSTVDLPATPWSSISGLDDVKRKLIQCFSVPQRNAALYRKLGIFPTMGVLLYGIPGTGKTMLAKAIATELNATFLSLSISQLVHSEVGESERIVDGLLDLALERSPSIVFLDELQAIFARRDGGGSLGDSVHDARLTSLILSRLDACREEFHRRPVMFVGATNRPELLDPALLGPGRMDVHICVPPPEEKARRRIISTALTTQRLVHSYQARQFVEDFLASATSGMSGADVANICNQFGLRLLSALQSTQPRADLHNPNGEVVEGSRMEARAAAPSEGSDLSEDLLRRCCNAALQGVSEDN